MVHGCVCTRVRVYGCIRGGLFVTEYTPIPYAKHARAHTHTRARTHTHTLTPTDNWIEEHCQDADVFVLVANAESTVKKSVFFFLVYFLLFLSSVFYVSSPLSFSLISEPGGGGGGDF